MKIIKANVTTREATADYITLDTDLPNPMHSEPQEKLYLGFRAPRGTGRAFVREHFPSVPIEMFGDERVRPK